MTWITDGYYTIRVEMKKNRSDMDVSKEFFKPLIRVWEDDMGIVMNVDHCLELLAMWDGNGENRIVEYKEFNGDEEDAAARLRHSDEWHEDLINIILGRTGVDAEEYDCCEDALDEAMDRMGLPKDYLYAGTGAGYVHGSPMSSSDFRDDSFFIDFDDIEVE